MKIIRLHGELGKLFGREYQLDVKTPAEAIRALCSQVKGFRVYLHKHAKDYYKVFVGTDSRSVETLDDPFSQKEVIRIVPVLQGAGGGFGRVVLGAALIAFSVWNPALAQVGLWGAGATATTIGSLAGSIGVSLMLGGVAQMLAGTPKMQSYDTKLPDNIKSYSFDGPINTTRQGNAVPLCYGGPIRVGSQVISAGLTTINVKV